MWCWHSFICFGNRKRPAPQGQGNGQWPKTKRNGLCDWRENGDARYPRLPWTSRGIRTVRKHTRQWQHEAQGCCGWYDSVTQPAIYIYICESIRLSEHVVCKKMPSRIKETNKTTNYSQHKSETEISARKLDHPNQIVFPYISNKLSLKKQGIWYKRTQKLFIPNHIRRNTCVCKLAAVRRRGHFSIRSNIKFPRKPSYIKLQNNSGS